MFGLEMPREHHGGGQRTERDSNRFGVAQDVRACGHRLRIICSVVAISLACSCRGAGEFLRDPAGDDRVFAGDPAVFLGKEVILQFRWGDREAYGAAIRCIILEGLPDAVIVKGLRSTEGSYPDLYSKLRRVARLQPIAGRPDVFRVRRDHINTIFEPRLG